MAATSSSTNAFANNVGMAQQCQPTRSRRALGDLTNATGSSAAPRATKPTTANPLHPVGGRAGTHLPTAQSSAGSAAVAAFAAPATARDPTDIDSKHARDPLEVTEYIDDIYRYFRETEGRHGPSAAYMSKQSDINEKMRAILIDWLVEVHLKFKLMPETMYLTVNLIDRFLEVYKVQRQKLQLVGVTAMLLASKYEEIYPPEVRDFVYITDKAYTRDEILKMETIMLNTLRFNLTVPTHISFLARFVKAARANSKTKQLAAFYTERCLQEYKMLKYLPSTVAASAVYIAQRAMGASPAWTPALIRHTNYTEATIQPCVNDMLEVLEKGKKSSLQAVRKKYTSGKFLEVALMPLPSAPSADQIASS